MSIIDDLQKIGQDVLEGIQETASLVDLDNVRVQALGKKGELTSVLRSMGSISADERPKVGKYANEIRAKVEEELEARRALLEQQALARRISADSVDVTLPGRVPSVGHEHLISQIVDEIEDIFTGIGYTVEDGPYVETEYYNFTSLNAPADHPSRSPRDTFYIKDSTKPSHSLISDVLLRTQTSPVQMRTMEVQKPPIYMICPGRVFRPDTADANHLPQFTQIEGLVVDKGISFADLKGTLDHMTKAIFGEDRATRYRPHFFPFTEPSCEVDVSCGVCHGKGCRFCNNTGWIEILGCGMVDPNVFAYAGIDPEVYSGFAFGIGAERVAALRYDLPDLRMLMTGSTRFLEQF